MTYFTKDDHQAVLSLEATSTQASSAIERVHTRMVDLQRRLSSRLKQHDIRIYPNPLVPGGVSQRSSAAPFLSAVMAAGFMRSAAQSLTVERILGLDEGCDNPDTKPYLHPTIEVRLTPDHLVVELIVAPDARYDQENFAGKLTVQQHRMALFEMLSNLQSNYYLGFWSGVHLDEMHLETDNLPPQRILLEFLDTFAAGRDMLRVGYWYNAEDEALNEHSILDAVFQNMRELHELYTFLLWTSDNNFHSFYKKVATR